MANVNSILADVTADPPKFFHDAGGRPVAWSVGIDVLAFLAEHVTPKSRTLETGAGVSTVAFAALGATHTSVVPSAEVVGRIREYCTGRGVPLAHTTFVIDRSENYLPRA